MATLRKKAAVPIYEQIMGDLSEKLTSGAIVPGAQLPSELELAACYNVSRVTIRTVLKKLSDQGQVCRRKGKGTFAADNPKEGGEDLFAIVYFGQSQAVANLFFTEVLGGIQAEFGARHPLAIVNWHEGIEAEALRKYKGLFLMYSANAPVGAFKILKSLHVPMVCLSSFPESLADVPSVAVDNVAGAFKATEHLLKLGHTRIAFLSTNPQNSSFNARLQGYEKALRRHGLEPDNQLIIRHEQNIVADEKRGYRDMQRVFAVPPFPTAVLTGNDFMALGAIKAARDMGLSVPAEVAVAGFDGLSLGAYVEPPLTTVQTDIPAIGMEAVKMLKKLLRGELVERRRILPVKLAVNASTAPAVKKNESRKTERRTAKC
jgi:DNA-binding LacI/PurR family transcriptional regulator